MTIYYSISLFILGCVLGSFYNVVGHRLPEGKSIVKPPSKCDDCGYELSILDLIPIFSYLFLRGKCRNCGKKIDPMHLIVEIVTGILFVISYLIFGMNFELLIVLTFVSMIVIITISDIKYMIISDEVLLVTIAFLLIEMLFIRGFKATGLAIISGILSFTVMYVFKIIGDFMFKKESMGGGDIKMMFVFGLMIGFPMALISIIIGSVCALPISLFFMKKKKGNIIPFGPFLAMGALIVVLLKIDINFIIDIFTKGFWSL